MKAFVTPPKSVENDLRSFSLTSPIATVLEGFSAEALITSEFNKLDNKQFALPGRSTTQALNFFMHTILETLDTCGRYTFLTNRIQRVRIGNSLSPPVGLNGWTPQGTKLAPLLFCILVNGMAAKCKSRVKYEDDLTFHLQYLISCLLYTSPSPRDQRGSRMPSSA